MWTIVLYRLTLERKKNYSFTILFNGFECQPHRIYIFSLVVIRTTTILDHFPFTCEL